jgi:hypothetical protein
MEEFNEKHVRLFYRLLDHSNETELRFLKRGTYSSYKFIKNEDEFVEACKKWNGKKNIYTVIRERDPELRKCATAYDIVGFETILIDIDPVRMAEIPSNEKELKNAIKVAKIIADWFVLQKFKKPYIAMTGNGACLYFSVPYYEIKDENRNDVSFMFEQFETKLRELFKKELKKYNCRIDNMYDFSRIAKVIGTMSVKGENTAERPWRLSYWIEEPYKRKADRKLLNAIINRNLIDSQVNKSPGASVSRKFTTEPNQTSATNQLQPVWLMQPIPYFGEELQGNWIYEQKIDGWRLEIIKDSNDVKFWGRRLERNPNWTEKLKAIPKDSLKDIPEGTVLDAELYTDRGRRFVPSLFTYNQKAKPIVFIFDVIFYKGNFTGNLPLKERKEILQSMKFKKPFYIIKFKKVKNLEEHLREAVSKGFEGIVIKELNSPYVTGENSPMVTQYWRKIKP